MKYLSIIFIFMLLSCKVYQPKKANTIQLTDTVKQVDYRLYLGTIIPDTILRQLREYKKENHLLRVEIDDLKSKLEKVRKLQKLDSILSKNEEDENER